MKRYTKIAGLISLYLFAFLLLVVSPQSAKSMGVVGSGTADSCTEAALDTALGGGGNITFNCGSSVVTIPITHQKIITTNTTVDGGHLIILSGAGERLFAVAQTSPQVGLTVQNITLEKGLASQSDGSAIYSFGDVTINNSVIRFNGIGNNLDPTTAIVNQFGNITINNSLFYGNNGGAASTYGLLTISNTTITNNGSAQSSVTYTAYGQTANIFNTTISNNQSVGITSNNLTLTNSIITHNKWAGVEAGSATVSGSTISFNGTGTYNFGGIRVYGNSSITDSNITNNSGRAGGGVYFDPLYIGTLDIINSTISGNEATTYGGGGVYAATEGTINIVGSTISDNTSDIGFYGGGGVYNALKATINISNSTIFRNNVIYSQTFIIQSAGGGLKNSIYGRIYITNSTITQNSADLGAGIYMEDSFVAPVVLKNTIISNNTGGNCNSYVSDGGNNLQFPGTTCNNTISSADPKLGVLLVNGSTTKIYPLKMDSPAINAGNNTVCAAAPVNGKDQRGVTRPQGANCDIGAVEMNILTVNSTADTSDGSCDALGSGGGNQDCTLREALNVANTNPGSFIYFNIAGSGVKSITPATPLPVLTNPVAIDGTTQNTVSCGTSPTTAALLIEINGTYAGQSSSGLTFAGGSSTIRGLVINHFGSNGINLTTKGNNLLECNFIGTNAAGTSAAGNGGDGVSINGASNNMLGWANIPSSWNLISGNTGAGIRVILGQNNTATGNWIGFNSNGTGTIKNLGGGIKILADSQFNLGAGNKIKN